MNFTEIRRLVKLVESSQISELEIEEENTRVRILKISESNRVVPMTEMVVPTAQAPLPAFVPAMQTPSATPEAPPADLKANEIFVESPMVGTFYQAPDPDAAPFVTKGAQVKQGDTLCIIESMKMMNRITSEYTGMLEEVLVENASGVEYDQPLFVIKSAS